MRFAVLRKGHSANVDQIVVAQNTICVYMFIYIMPIYNKEFRADDKTNIERNILRH